jgi:hypothetical protein
LKSAEFNHPDNQPLAAAAHQKLTSDPSFFYLCFRRVQKPPANLSQPFDYQQQYRKSRPHLNLPPSLPLPVTAIAQQLVLIIGFAKVYKGTRFFITR